MAYLAELLLEVLMRTRHVLHVKVRVETAEFVAARGLVVVGVAKDAAGTVRLLTIGALYLVMTRTFEDRLHLLHLS